jgi:hypothetical protein
LLLAVSLAPENELQSELREITSATCYNSEKVFNQSETAAPKLVAGKKSFK